MAVKVTKGQICTGSISKFNVTRDTIYVESFILATIPLYAITIMHNFQHAISSKRVDKEQPQTDNCVGYKASYASCIQWNHGQVS